MDVEIRILTRGGLTVSRTKVISRSKRSVRTTAQSQGQTTGFPLGGRGEVRKDWKYC